MAVNFGIQVLITCSHDHDYRKRSRGDVEINCMVREMGMKDGCGCLVCKSNQRLIFYRQQYGLCQIKIASGDGPKSIGIVEKDRSLTGGDERQEIRARRPSQYIR